MGRNAPNLLSAALLSLAALSCVDAAAQLAPKAAVQRYGEDTRPLLVNGVERFGDSTGRLAGI